MPWRAGDAAAGMAARTAHIKTFEWSAICTVTEHRPCRPQLIEAHIAVHDIAASKAKFPFKTKRTEDLVTKDRGAKARRIGLYSVDDSVGCLAFVCVPVMVGRELLAEQAGYMLAFRRKTVVDG